VGPRPERPFFVDQFRVAVPGYDDRHRVPAGLTGWAQVHGLRGDTSIKERALFDNHYVEHWSLWRDVVIIFRTVGAVLSGVLVATVLSTGIGLTWWSLGAAIAASLLLEPGDDPPAELRVLGDRLLAGLWEEIDELPPIPDCAERPNLGMAHGWAGTLYASLRWCRASGTPLPAGLPARLSELADLARPWGRGLRWRWYSESGGDFGAMAGWCNGSAGFVFLWTLAGRMLGEPRFGRLAEGAAWNAWEDPIRDTTLCCGLAGRAYALLSLHRHGGGPEWLERARDLAERAAGEAARSSGPSHGLYKGDVGLAALVADLAHPADAAMPFFEEEGWTPPSAPNPAGA